MTLPRLLFAFAVCTLLGVSLGAGAVVYQVNRFLFTENRAMRETLTKTVERVFGQPQEVVIPEGELERLERMRRRR